MAFFRAGAEGMRDPSLGGDRKGHQAAREGLQASDEARDSPLAAHGERLLSLEEVMESGLPAFFFDYGDVLLCLEGDLFSVQAGDEARAQPVLVPLPPAILKRGLGIEYGWRHLLDCTCCLRAEETMHEAA
jgi:hypothetical protein